MKSVALLTLLMIILWPANEVRERHLDLVSLQNHFTGAKRAQRRDIVFAVRVVIRYLHSTARLGTSNNDLTHSICENRSLDL